MVRWQLEEEEAAMALLEDARKWSKIEIMSNKSDCVLCSVRRVSCCSLLFSLLKDKKRESPRFPTHQRHNATELCLKMKPITYLSQNQVSNLFFSAVEMKLKMKTFYLQESES